MASEIHSLIFETIENLRPKLLDLTRNNPLISTKMGDRSIGSYIRVVDELPDVLLSQLIGQKIMEFSPLPPDGAEPQDEKTEEFNTAYLEATLTDQIYLKQLMVIDEVEEDDTLDKIAKCERDLRDRLREKLGLPARATGKAFSHITHAKIHGISPSYQLPEPSEEHDDGRHTDNLIQTLLMPEKMQRSLTNIISKNRSWEQETGIAVLQGAFGFLEWTDGSDDKKSLSPLVLVPVKVEKKKTTKGLIFEIQGKGDAGIGNSVLAEKLERDLKIKLPPYTGPSVEKYLEEIAAMKPLNIHWRVKRYVTFGVFPSAKMAMYRDLDLNPATYTPSEVIEKLLTSAPTGVEGVSHEDYNVDSPEIEAKVPVVIADADSSQFSVMVDIANGENLAVEGPPGTGKSQTIVNTIASAISSGKKVLFVAEKLAALDVVKSRLEAWGLGEFVLPLQASKSAREQVVQSIRDRINVYAPSVDAEYDSKLAGFKSAREEIADYLSILKSEYLSTGFTVHEILGKQINSRRHIEEYPRKLQTYGLTGGDNYTRHKFEQAISIAQEIREHWNKIKEFGRGWRGAKMASPTRFEAEDIADLVLQMSKKAARAKFLYRKLDEDLRSVDIDDGDLQSIHDILTQVSEKSGSEDREKAGYLITGDNLDNYQNFIEECRIFQTRHSNLEWMFREEVKLENISVIEKLDSITKSLNLKNIGVEEFARVKQQVQDKSDVYGDAEKKLSQFFKLCPELAGIKFERIAKIKSVIGNIEKDIFTLRNEKTSGPDSETEIYEILSTHETIQAAHKEIGSLVNMLEVGDLETVKNHLEVLETTGFFSRAFAKYKGSFAYAKRASSVYGTIDRVSLIARLKGAREILIKEQVFANKTSLKLRLQSRFKGMKTDFILLKKYLEFVEYIDRKFIGIEGKLIKNFIFQRPFDVLVDIPDVDNLDSGMDIESLRKKIRSLDEQKKYLRDLGNQFSELTAIFKAAKNVNSSDLKNIAQSIQVYCDAKEAISGMSEISSFLGEEFDGGNTPLDALKQECEIAAIISKIPDHMEQVRNIYLQSSVQMEAGRLAGFLEASDAITDLRDDVEKRAQISFDTPDDRSYSDWSEFLAKTSTEVDGLLANSEFYVSKQEFRGYGFIQLVDELIGIDGDLDNIENVMTAILARNLALSVFNHYGTELSRFRGEKLSRLRKQLADYDLEIQSLSRKKIRSELVNDARMESGISTGRRSEYTEMSMLNHQIGLKRGFQPVRELIRRAGSSLQELKPCWMMSPLAIAQYIDLGAVEFDLVVIDEASQMTVENSIGALLRSKQVMIVGDTNQLPPSSFFKKMIDVVDDVDEDLQILEESILDKANTVLTKRQLKWHYRSRHSDLIAYSNNKVYDDKLVVFPSANPADPNMGVKLVETESSYHSGVNKLEADKVVAAALRFMKDHPERSLGIVALNKSQASLIEQEMDHARYNHQSAQDYYEYWENANDGLETFFVKNLENVQGDERDVIFISTVYGPSAPGVRVKQHFGPINGVAGKRRLNVLFSRAKEQIVTFSSMKPTDIVVEDPSLINGRAMLRGWLEYSATGRLPMSTETDREPDSEFEIAVIREIEAMGLQAVPQVGSSNYFIDIGIKHPEWPYGYVLGVECDGATYHSSKSARDRDRIRQSVLESLGWRLHRIWSTDWFNDPASQVTRLKEVVEEQLARLKVELEAKSQNVEFAKTEAITENYLEENVDEVPEAREASELIIVEPGKRETAQGDLLSSIENSGKVRPLSAEKENNVATEILNEEVQLGDRITFKYLDRDKNRMVVKLSDVRHEPENGIINIGSELGGALLGAELDEEISVLVGPYLRKGVVEKIEK